MSNMTESSFDLNLMSQTSETRRNELSRDIVAAAFVRGQFTMSSGRSSRYYLDKYMFETKPTILRRLASELAKLLPPDVDRIAGSALGAVPLTVALSLETGLPFVIVRSQSTSPLSKTVEGELHPGERVSAIEDVVTSGEHALQTVRRLQESFAVVVGTYAVIDRDEGARQAFGEAGVRLTALFSIDELRM